MADRCLTTTQTTDRESPSLDPDADTHCINVGVAVTEASSTGVAFFDMPTDVLEISNAEYSGDDDDDDENEENNGLSYPGYVEKAFFYFEQTTRPRNWCLQLVTWPYPLWLCMHFTETF